MGKQNIQAKSGYFHRERFGKLTFPALAVTKGLTLDTSVFQILQVVVRLLSSPLIKPNFRVGSADAAPQFP